MRQVLAVASSTFQSAVADNTSLLSRICCKEEGELRMKSPERKKIGGKGGRKKGGYKGGHRKKKRRKMKKRKEQKEENK